jgi:small-conductance mechanosensitive channel
MMRWSDIQELLELPGVLALGIVVGSILAAYVVEFVIRKTLVFLARRTGTQLDDEIVDALRKPVFLSVVFFGLGWAMTTVEATDRVRFVTHAVLQTLAIIVWTVAAVRVGGALLAALSRRAGEHSIVQPRTQPVFDIVVKIAVIAAAVYFVFIVWEIDLTAWLASAGIVGIAVGFAAKDTLANLFSGIFIVADAPYKVGDYIVLDDGLRGQVTRIGIRSTRILTRNDVEITIPNAVIGASKIVNEAGGPHVKQRVDVEVSVAYGSDVDQVREVMLGCTEGVEDVAEKPAPRVRFRRFGDSGLLFELLVWVGDPALRGVVVDELNTRIYKAFAAANIEIPYSKHDVHIKEMPQTSGLRRP